MGYIYGVLPPVPSLRPFVGVRPVKPHITLVKVGRPVRVEIRYRQFVALVGPPVLLPSEVRPRYIALRVEPHGEFAALRTLLASALGGLVEERYRDFRPHLTMYEVRIKRPTVEDIAPAVEEVERFVGTAFEVKALYLIDTTGGVYTPVYTIQLP